MDFFGITSPRPSTCSIISSKRSFTLSPRQTQIGPASQLHLQLPPLLLLLLLLLQDEYNGSAVVAMAGSSCVGLASDRRLGVNRFNTISNEFDKCFRINPQCFVAFPGLATDVQTMSVAASLHYLQEAGFVVLLRRFNQLCVFLSLCPFVCLFACLHKELQFRCNLFSLREDVAVMPPSLVSSLISSMLYQRRFAPFFVSPVVAGLEPSSHKPFLAGFDCIGAACKATDFVCNGTAKEQLAGICEAMWRPDMSFCPFFSLTFGFQTKKS
ncbi:hypothetical protein Efla_000363 [Eimeria flavescens]